MVVEWRQQMYGAALEEVGRFVRQNPEYALDDQALAGVEYQLDGGGTNFVLWGHYRDQPVAFKYFHPDWGAPRWRNERAGLAHFASIGMVPKVRAVVAERLIVMSRLPGRFIGEEAALLGGDSAGLARLGRELGQVLGRMVDLPLPQAGQGYSIVRDYGVIPWSAELGEAVGFYLRLCREEQRQSPGGADPFYEQSLALVESQLARLPGQRQVIFHEDFHCFAERGRLTGVFDLEMARLGTELMQAERVFRECAPGGVAWGDVLEGYRAETGRDISGEDYVFMLAMALFYFHIRIVRWGEPDREADYVAEYLPALREEARRYTDYVDVKRYLPGLE